MYSSAIFIPPLFLILLLISWITQGIGQLFDSEIFNSIFSSILGLIIGFIAAILTKKLISRLNERDKESELELLDTREYEYLIEAKKMIESGFISQSISLIYSAIESAFQRLFLAKDHATFRRNLRNLVQLAKNKEFIDNTTYNRVRMISKLRNHEVHAHAKRKEIDKDEALNYLSIAYEIINELDNIEPEF